VFDLGRRSRVRYRRLCQSGGEAGTKERRMQEKLPAQKDDATGGSTVAARLAEGFSRRLLQKAGVICFAAG